MIKTGYDWQGWPFYALTLREMLTKLGFEEEDGKLTIPSDADILDAYPTLLVDDGMGYGVDKEYIVEVDKDTYEDTINGVEDGDDEITLTENNVNAFNIFREKMPDERIKYIYNELYTKKNNDDEVF